MRHVEAIDVVGGSGVDVYRLVPVVDRRITGAVHKPPLGVAAAAHPDLDPGGPQRAYSRFHGCLIRLCPDRGADARTGKVKLEWIDRLAVQMLDEKAFQTGIRQRHAVEGTLRQYRIREGSSEEQDDEIEPQLLLERLDVTGIADDHLRPQVDASPLSSCHYSVPIDAVGTQSTGPSRSPGRGVPRLVVAFVNTVTYSGAEAPGSQGARPRRVVGARGGSAT